MTSLASTTTNSTSSADFAPETDLRIPNRRIWVITTASLPWRTGTSVNPLARALYLTRGRPSGYVTLLCPWLPQREDQSKLFGSGCLFDTTSEHEEWIRRYIRQGMGCMSEESNLRIRFYEAVYNESFGSIFATEDM